MNLFLNDLGAVTSRVGASMLWQTTALVLLLLLVEFTVGRRLRPALGCALWLLVVVKLWLPPSLQLPTGAGYWLGPWLAAPRHVSPPARMTIAVPVIEPETDPVAVPSPGLELAPLPTMRTSLDFFGGLALVWFAGSAALGGWLIRCNREVHRLVRDAEPAPPEYQKRLEEAAARIGLRRRPELRLTRAHHSPAVCGLFRPVILLPVALTQRLTATALSDVLLHELVHVQRRDLWFHLPQALAQVVWWWNPCVWLANARIRALREQAVDEGVMRVRSGDPATYPATLVEVARHCASRPAVMLSLVGILESRRALRVRVERLLNSGVPRRAGLGWSGWLVVLVAALVTLPMAFARRVEVQPSPSFSMNPALAQRYGPTGRPSPTSEADTISRPNSYQMDPLIRTPHIPYIGAERQRIQNKLDRIILNEVQFDGLPLSEVVNYLDEQVRARDPEGRGLNFIINSTLEVSPPSAVPPIEPHTGRAIPAEPAEPMDLNRVTIRLGPGLRKVRVAEVLDAIVASAEQPLVYRVEYYAVVFSARPPEIPQLHTRRFQVDTPTFLEAVQAVAEMPKELRSHDLSTLRAAIAARTAVGTPRELPPADRAETNHVSTARKMVGEFFRTLGVDLLPPNPATVSTVPPGAVQTAIFFNDRTGTLFVRATLTDLNLIEKTLRDLNLMVAQVPSDGLTGPSAPASEAATPAATASPPSAQQMDPILPRRSGSIPDPSSAGRERIRAKLDEIILEEVKFDGRSLREVVDLLGKQVRALDPAQTGVNFIIGSSTDSDVGSPAAATEPKDLGGVRIRQSLSLSNIRLGDALDFLVTWAEQPLAYQVEDYAVVFSARPPRSTQLHTRVFRVDTLVFLEAARHLVESVSIVQPGKTQPASTGGPSQTTTVKESLRSLSEFFRQCGIDFSPSSSAEVDGHPPPAGQKVFHLNSSAGMLFVRATLEDLEVIERVIGMLNLTTIQVRVEVLFAEVEAEMEKALGLDWFVSRPLNSTNASFDVTGKVTGILTELPMITDPFLAKYASLEATGILTEPQLRTVIKAFEQRGGATLTAAPGFTTGNGNQIRVNMIENTVSLVDPATRRTNGLSVDRNLHMQLRVSADLRSVYLTTGVHMNQVVVGDGQTVVLTGEDPAVASGQDQKAGPGEPAVKRKRLWVFITPTLLDSAGQRVNPPNTTRP